MKRNADGEKWLNGLIAYNSNCIVMRGNDSNFGQPGFMYMAGFYNRLGTRILEDYILPHVIKNINAAEFNTRSDANKIMNFITETYNTVHKQKMDLINGDKVSIMTLTEATVFSDSLPKETLNKSLDEKDIKIFQLEKKLATLTDKLNQIEEKMKEIEEMYLDISINKIK